MKKLLSRYFVLVFLLGCLGLITAADLRAGANPPCPLGCHNNCRAELYDCLQECDGQRGCEPKCLNELHACIDYCDWVCGPE
jgi:hypothetical protein